MKYIGIFICICLTLLILFFCIKLIIDVINIIKDKKNGKKKKTGFTKATNIQNEDKKISERTTTGTSENH